MCVHFWIICNFIALKHQTKDNETGREKESALCRLSDLSVILKKFQLLLPVRAAHTAYFGGILWIYYDAVNEQQQWHG